MKSLAGLLLLAAAASASVSPWLALAASWAALIVAVMWAINAYRGRIEQWAGSGLGVSPAPATDTIIGTIYQRRGRLVLRRRRRP